MTVALTNGSLCRLLVGLAFLSLAASVHAQTPAAVPPAEALTDARVVASITRGIDYLIKDVDAKLLPLKKFPDNQRVDHIAEPGELMLETYALLYIGSGVRDQRLQIHDERMKNLIDILLRLDSVETYTTALQTLALGQLPQTPEVKKAINRTATKLIKGRTKVGGYVYHLDQTTSDGHDQSNSQYGLLGVWAAADWGVVVPASYWKETSDFWRSNQFPAGGWNYSQGLVMTKPMTAAGVASLLVCEEFLNHSVGLEPRPNVPIERGLAALITDFDPNSNDFYYLYGVERAGLASGSKFFGKHDWYREVAANVLHAQQNEGDFASSFSGTNAVRATCYAILILGRGRAPVVMNKLQYDGPWNARPRDNANLHAQLARDFERHLNWQSVPLSAFPEDWLDAPVLLITGSKDPNFTSDEVAKLRQYVNNGGLIYSVADGESKEFSDAVARYAAQMILPDPLHEEFKFRELPSDHPLFRVRGQYANPPKTFGISNGVRELWIHSPQDFGAAWQSVDKNKKDAWDIPAALLVYMAGQEGLRSRLQALSVPAPAKSPRWHITIAQLQHTGNWDPEPGAWPRLARIMALQSDTALDIKDVAITDLPKMADPPVLAHLAGTTKLTLTPEETKALQDYVAAGGTLFVEAIGGKEEFATSAAEALKTVFPEGKLSVIRPEYSLFTGDMFPLYVDDKPVRTPFPATAHIDEVEYRRLWVQEHGRLTVPRIQCMTLKKRAAVLFSAEDITSGLLGSNTWAIGGYAPDSAIAIARNIVLFSWRNSRAFQAAKSLATRP